MKSNYLILFLLAFCTCFFSGCELVQGIFEAGVWTGLLMVAVVIAIIIFIVMKIGKGKS